MSIPFDFQTKRKASDDMELNDSGCVASGSLCRAAHQSDTFYSQAGCRNNAFKRMVPPQGMTGQSLFLQPAPDTGFLRNPEFSASMMYYDEERIHILSQTAVGIRVQAPPNEVSS